MAKKSYRRSKRGKDDARKADYRGGSTTSGGNGSLVDVNWYTRYPNLSVASASFPYPYRPGMLLPIWNKDNLASPSGNVFTSTSIPGVMEIGWMPSVGVSTSPTDPASLVGREIYAQVRKSFSGSLDVDAPDFVMYLMALDSIYAVIAHFKRIYRTLNVYTPENYLYPEALLRAMGVNSKDMLSLQSQRVQLWQVINELILMTRKFYVPASMDVFNRHYQLSDNVYTDADSLNSQVYVLHMLQCFQFAELDTPDNVAASGLEYVKIPGDNNSSTLSAESIFQFVRGLIDALSSWDDAYTIAGYLRRAYEGRPEFVLGELGLDETLTPIYNEVVLTQIENSRACAPYFFNTEPVLPTGNVTQDPKTNSVLSKPMVSISLSTMIGTGMESTFNNILPTINLRTDNPTVADNIIATRLLNSYTNVEQGLTPDGKTNTFTANVVAGTELVVAMWLVANVPASGSSDNPVWTLTRQPLRTVTQRIFHAPDIENLYMPEGYFDMVADAYVHQFDWCPMRFWAITTCVEQGSELNRCYFVPNGDVHNMTVITREDLANLHRICVYSEFDAFSQMT